MNCPYCESEGLYVEVYVSPTLIRCYHCSRDLLCSIPSDTLQKLDTRQRTRFTVKQAEVMK